MDFSERLKNLRIEKGLTQVELAKMIGLASQSSYQKYETGGAKPRAIKIEKLASLFNVSVSYLLGETDIRSTSEILEIMETLTKENQDMVIDYAKMLRDKQNHAR
jgi:transcriptional regulator with XRE-family HTH domain